MIGYLPLLLAIGSILSLGSAVVMFDPTTVMNRLLGGLGFFLIGLSLGWSAPL